MKTFEAVSKALSCLTSGVTLFFLWRMMEMMPQSTIQTVGSWWFCLMSYFCGIIGAGILVLVFIRESLK